MNQCFKSLFAMVVFPLLLLLNGCNSEGGFSESTIKLERIDIVASPITTRGLSELTLAKGNTQPFQAIGHYSDGSSRTLTDLNVNDWHTSNLEAGHFDKPSVFTASEVGSTTLTVTKDGVTSNTVDVNVSAAVITSIQVTPSPVNIAKGQTQQLTATATYSDMTSSDISRSVTWSPVDANTVIVSPSGLLSGVKAGNTELTATQDGVTSNTVSVNVSAAIITAIQVSPSPVNIAKGQTQQLTATATYSDMTSSDISRSVTWSPVDANTVIVSPSGLLSGVKAGNTELTATQDGVTSNTVSVNVSAAIITAIQVSPSPVNIAKGQTQQLTATATYSDMTSSDISRSVTWSPVDTNTVTVSSSGLLSGVKAGNTELTATQDGVTSNTVKVNVSAAIITVIQVSPSPVNIAKGQTQQLTATATYSDMTSSDISRSVTWSPVDTNTVTVSSSGLLSGVKAGNTKLTATQDGVTSNKVSVNVSAAIITAIQVSPSPVNIAKGQTQQLTATATYSDMTSSDISRSVTWSPVDTNTVTVSSSGLLSGVEVGNTTLTVTKDGVTSNTVKVNVSAAIITAIQVSPSPVNIAKGQTQQLTATATYSDMTSSDISRSVTWSPVDTNTVTVSSSGLLSGVEADNTELTATQDGVTSNTVSVNVSAAIITAIQVSPSPVNIVKGQTQQLTATATYSDMTSSDISRSVTWSPVDINTVTVSSSGLLSGVKAGNTKLTATQDGMTSNRVSVNVCNDLAGACIDIFDIGSGKLFTNSPSKAYLDSIGGSAAKGVHNGASTPNASPMGEFYVFDWISAKTLCAAYNASNVGGRTNWRLPTIDELTELFGVTGNLFKTRGWPASHYHSSVTPSSSAPNNYKTINITDGFVLPLDVNYNNFASCVSNP